MRITLVMVATINGKTTRDGESDISKWTSKEDSKHFSTMIGDATLIVMGSTTYKAAKEVMELNEETRRIILTRNPKEYKDETVPGQLEFTDENAKVLVERLKKIGYKEMLLVGGGEINKLFFEANLVTDLYLTVEPKLFGKGKPLIAEGDFMTDAELESVTKLNNKGTILLHYTIHYTQE